MNHQTEINKGTKQVAGPSPIAEPRESLVVEIREAFAAEIREFPLFWQLLCALSFIGLVAFGLSKVPASTNFLAWVPPLTSPLFWVGVFLLGSIGKVARKHWLLRKLRRASAVAQTTPRC